MTEKMRSIVSFLTTIPVGGMSIEDAARNSYLFPVVAVIVGFIVGSLSLIFFQYLPPALAAILTVLALYLVTGINHVDGFADFADGMYVMGDSEKKLRVMKDVRLGVAGFLSLFFLLSLYLFGFYETAGEVSLIIVAEVSAKTAMLTSIFFGRPRGVGLGDVFIKNLNRRFYPFSVLFSLLFCFYLAQYIGLFVVVLSVLIAFSLVFLAHRNFGYTTGDVMGAINEIVRLIVLLLMVFLR